MYPVVSGEVQKRRGREGKQEHWNNKINLYGVEFIEYRAENAMFKINLVMFKRNVQVFKLCTVKNYNKCDQSAAR